MLQNKLHVFCCPFFDTFMLRRFENHSALELPRTALEGCRHAASRLREAARWQ